jgi:hypothetical protein
MNRFLFARTATTCVVLLVFHLSAWAQDSAEVKTTTVDKSITSVTVLDSLNNPFSVAVEPQSDVVFVCESGAQQIIKVVDGKPVPVIGDLEPLLFNDFKAGPIGIHFLAKGMLLVGHGASATEGSLSRFTIVANQEKTLQSKDALETVKLQLASDAKPLGLFSSICSKHANVYAVTHGDPENGWIAISEIAKEKLTSFRPLIPTAKKSGYVSPTSMTISPGGEYLVVSQMGTKGTSKDSQLTFYGLQGSLKENYEVELQDIVDIDYSPKRKHLFAIDYCFEDPSKAALYKLIGKGTDGCTAKKLIDIPHAISMAFDSQGSLYVVTLGDVAEVANANPVGKLLKIEGLDEVPEAIASPKGNGQETTDVDQSNSGKKDGQ